MLNDMTNKNRDIMQVFTSSSDNCFGPDVLVGVSICFCFHSVLSKYLSFS